VIDAANVPQQRQANRGCCGQPHPRQIRNAIGRHRATR
jgi:hypothetical protein